MPRNFSSLWNTSVAQREARCDAFGEAAEVLAHALAERLQCLEAGAAPGGVEADAPGAVVIDGDKHRRLALSRPGGGHVGAPHAVQRLGDDGTVVVTRPPTQAGAAALRAVLERVASSKSVNTLHHRPGDLVARGGRAWGGADAGNPCGAGGFVSWLRDERGCSPSTIRRRLADVGWVHRLAWSPIDLKHALIAGAVAETAAPQCQAAAILLTDLKRMPDEAGAGIQGVRKRALLLLGWAGRVPSEPGSSTAG
jgi:hypothetical protein